MSVIVEGTGKKPHGFAAWDKRKLLETSSRGGKAAHEQGRAYRFTSEAARAASKRAAENRTRAAKEREARTMASSTEAVVTNTSGPKAA